MTTSKSKGRHKKKIATAVHALQNMYDFHILVLQRTTKKFVQRFITFSLPLSSSWTAQTTLHTHTDQHERGYPSCPYCGFAARAGRPERKRKIPSAAREKKPLILRVAWTRSPTGLLLETSWRVLTAFSPRAVSPAKTALREQTAG